MSSERFYRGSSRSPFRTSYTDGTISPQTARDFVVLSAPGSAQDSRLKRVQVAIVVPKGSSIRKGWFAFLRIPDQGSIETATVDIDAPSVLRPKVWISNPDHAIYVEVYLEAVNLAAGERLAIIGYSNGSAYACHFAAKWYAESELH